MTIPPDMKVLLSLMLLSLTLSASAAKVAGTPNGFKLPQQNTNSVLPNVGRSTSLPVLPATGLSSASVVAPTNRPLVVDFNPAPSGWFTNADLRQTSSSTGTNAGWVWDTNIVVTARLKYPAFTNYLVTLTTGTNLATAWTNRPGIVTNRGPLTFSVSPTNQYVFTLWGYAADGQLRYLDQAKFPSAPSNVVSFIILPLFAPTLETPEAQWVAGSNVFTLSITNPAGGSRFMRAAVRVVQDDFTPKTVTLGNTFQLSP